MSSHFLESWASACPVAAGERKTNTVTTNVPFPPPFPHHFFTEHNIHSIENPQSAVPSCPVPALTDPVPTCCKGQHGELRKSWHCAGRAQHLPQPCRAIASMSASATATVQLQRQGLLWRKRPPLIPALHTHKAALCMYQAERAAEGRQPVPLPWGCTGWGSQTKLEPQCARPVH